MDDGVPLRIHLMSLWRQDGYAPEKMPEQLDVPECPEGMQYLMGYFAEMNKRRGSNGWGFNPLSFGDLEAWARSRNISLLPFERAALDGLEAVFLKIHNRTKKK